MRTKPERKLDDFIPAMLAKEKDKPFSDNEWIYEIKWDGYRAIAELNKSSVKLYSRNGNSFADSYPPVFDALQSLKAKAVVDGEIVVINEDGNPDFQKLQHYDGNRHLPIHYYIFDLLELNGKQLYHLPLIERKALLQKLIPADGPVLKYSDHVEEQGEEFFHLIEQRNMEGIMAKRKGSEYYPGKRTSDWLKIKHHKSDEAIIAGFTSPRGGRKYFGALILGIYVDGVFRYIGHTGSGFNTELLKDLYQQLQPLIIDESPFEERVKTNMPVTWVQPKLVCELKFTEWTSDGKLRHPIFLRLRTDKKPGQVNTEYLNNSPMATRTTAKKAASAPTKPPKKAAAKTAKKAVAKSSAAKAETNATKDLVKNEKDKTYKFGKVEVKTTNRSKIFFPESGITKGDVIDYYDRMADIILPYLKDRPQSLFRTPNGINAKGFFHKDAGVEAPSFVKSVPLYSESTNKDVNYILCNNKATLLYLVNMGSIEINPWHSRLKSLDNPDYMIIDIDPSDNNTFEQVIEAALVVKDILDAAGATSVCKTSGASGLHIYVPMGKKYTYEQVKDFAYLVCMIANQNIPAFTTLERSLSKRRKDQIYMDYLQNRRGQTIASVYSLRPKPGATVSTPLQWEEVKPGLSPKDFTIFNIEERFKKVGDLFTPAVGPGVDLRKCLQNLEAK